MCSFSLNKLQDLEVSKFFVSCHFKNVENNIVWYFMGVYGPTMTQDREDFWVELGAIRGLWGGGGGGGTMVCGWGFQCN